MGLKQEIEKLGRVTPEKQGKWHTVLKLWHETEAEVKDRYEAANGSIAEDDNFIIWNAGRGGQWKPDGLWHWNEPHPVHGYTGIYGEPSKKPAEVEWV